MPWKLECCAHFYFIFVFNSLFSGAVVQLKSITSALSGNESLSSIFLDTTRLLLQILLYVVSIICGYIDLNTNLYEKAQFRSHAEFSIPCWGASSNDSPSGVKVPIETRLYWHQKAVLSVMEAGSLNWLVGKVGAFKISIHVHLTW